ncbi:MAG: hypothetical protein WDM89_17750 [Rhizomicrobium sp.]
MTAIALGSYACLIVLRAAALRERGLPSPRTRWPQSDRAFMRRR